LTTRTLWLIVFQQSQLHKCQFSLRFIWLLDICWFLHFFSEIAYYSRLFRLFLFTFRKRTSWLFREWRSRRWSLDTVLWASKIIKINISFRFRLKIDLLVLKIQ
jgi:hypothetical protein